MQNLIVRREDYWLQAFQASDLPLVCDLLARDGTSFFSCCDESGGWSDDSSARWLGKVLSDQERYGFSRFKMMICSHDKEGNARASFAGWAGFTVLEETSEIALRYCVDEDICAQKPGLLARVSNDLIDWFFETTYFTHVVACVRTDDRNGRMLAQELGFGYRESRRMMDMPCDVFQRFSPSMQTLVAASA